MLAEMFLFDYRGDLPINPIGALWSVSTEMQFYLLAPMLILILIYLHERTGRAFVLMRILFLCAGTVLRMWIKVHIPSRMYSYGYAPLIPNLDIFLRGCRSICYRGLVSVSSRARHSLFPASHATH
jgi:peptidoglycan/LPS O-acetylase OafA/YrhL